MTYYELSKSLNALLYPDLIAANGLQPAIDKAFHSISSPLKADKLLFPALIICTVRQGSRFSQIYIATHERLFIFDFWLNNTVYGNGSTSVIDDVARAIHAWIIDELDTAAMRKQFQFFAPTELGEAYEAGTAIDYQWNNLLARWENEEKGLFNPLMSPVPLIRAAMLRPELRKLFPFTSHYKLRFDLQEYTSGADYPHAESLGDGRFCAYSRKYKVITKFHNDFEYQDYQYEILGQGSVDEVLDLIIKEIT